MIIHKGKLELTEKNPFDCYMVAFFTRDLKINFNKTRQKFTIPKEEVAFYIVYTSDNSRSYTGLATKHDLKHYNISSRIPVGRPAIPELNELKYDHSYCIPVYPSHILGNPKAAFTELFLQLETMNSRDPLGNVEFLNNSVDIFKMDKQIKCSSCRLFISKGKQPLDLITGVCETCRKTKKERLKQIYNTGYYIKKLANSEYTHDYCKEEHESKYYPVIDLATIPEESLEIPKRETGMIVVGLGSAGTNILDQIGRTKYLDDYVLIDYDKVEVKNLRNQWYTRSHCGLSKAASSEFILETINEIKPSVIRLNEKFDEDLIKNFKSKYIIQGLDNIKTRVEVLSAVEKDPEIAKFIIDTRYDNLECSIYLINTSDQHQMEYYKANLLYDGEALKEKEWTLEETENYLKAKGIPSGNCAKITQELGLGLGGSLYGVESECGIATPCGGSRCVKLWLRILNEKGIQKTNTNTCIAWNIIDIYKYASSFVTAAIRQIEENNYQPFIHIECTTDPLPTSMKLK